MAIQPSPPESERVLGQAQDDSNVLGGVQWLRRKMQGLTIQVWPVSPIIWFGMASAATLLDLKVFVQWVLPLLTKPLDINPNPAPAPPLELLEIILRFALFIVFVAIGILPLLITFLAVWRRWTNAGIRQANYWVWTCIEGAAVAFGHLFVFLQILTFNITGSPSYISSALWILHTIAIPYKSKNRIETDLPRIEEP